MFGGSSGFVDYLSDEEGLLPGLTTYHSSQPLLPLVLQLNVPEAPSEAVDDSLQSLG